MMCQKSGDFQNKNHHQIQCLLRWTFILKKYLSAEISVLFAPLSYFLGGISNVGNIEEEKVERQPFFLSLAMRRLGGRKALALVPKLYNVLPH